MKKQIKISQKKITVNPLLREVSSQWSFESRPGGWIIGTKTENGVSKRVRFSFEKFQKKFFLKASYAFGSNEFFGEFVETQRAGQGSQSASDLTAQFPGKVRKVLVTANQSVEANAPLLMVEAMKMEFAVKAHAKGIVKKVLVTEGQVLTPGQLLIDFEEAKT